MKLFLPSARATNYLLIVGFCSLGYALYIRYLAIEQSNVGLACAAGLDTWLCFSRRIAIALFDHTVFGWAALAVAALNLLRPSLVLFARRARASPASASCSTTSRCRRSPSACWRSALRVAHPSQTERQRGERRAQPERLPVGEAFIERDVRHRQREHAGGGPFGGADWRPSGRGIVTLCMTNGTTAAVSGANGKSR